MKIDTACEVHRHFYETCCELLGLPQYFIHRHYRLTRWNNRHPGNGRMEGYGQIRMYSPNLIHVMFRVPHSINKMFRSEEDVFAFLRSIRSPEG